MNSLVGVLILIVLGLLGARLSFNTDRAPTGSRVIIATGAHLLLFGFLLGSNVLGVLTRELITGLYPFLALGLGWIGLLFGLQLDYRQLRQFPGSYIFLALGQAVIAFAVFWAVGRYLLGLRAVMTPEADAALITAAATACISTPVGIALLSDTFQLRGRLTQLVFFVASIDALVGIAALQINYAVYHPAGFFASGATLAAWEWFALAVAVGVGFGVLFLWLTRPEPERDELMVLLLGLVIFTSGAALYLGLLPLFVSAVAGAVVANLSPIRENVYHYLREWEQPIYAILLILAGALLRFPTLIVLPLGIGYVLVRALAKLTGGFAISSVTPLPFATGPWIGLTLLTQGGITLAMAISVTLSYPTLDYAGLPLGDLVFSVVILGVVASDLIGPFLSRKLLRGAGEISEKVEEAVKSGEGPELTPQGFPGAARQRPPREEEP